MLWRIKAILFGKAESKFSRKWAFSNNLIFCFFSWVNEKSPVTELSSVCWGIKRVLCAAWWLSLTHACINAHACTHTHTHCQCALWFINTTAVDQVLLTEPALIPEECKSTCFWIDRFSDQRIYCHRSPPHHHHHIHLYPLPPPHPLPPL